MFGRLQTHLRNKFLAGILAAGPVVIVVWAALRIEELTRPLTTPLGFHFPGLGFAVALLGVYLLGLVVTSLLGKVFLGLLDRALARVPGLNLLLKTWKDVLVVPLDKAGTFHEVVLVAAPEGPGTQLGFTSGQPLPGDPGSICVFLPGVPNPLAGRLVLARREDCLPLPVSVEDAIKFLLSTGNYLPTELRSLPGKPAWPEASVLSAAARPSPGGEPVAS